MTYPDFLVIGAQKAGTTWLHRNLQAHPGIWMPKEKELHYFDEKTKNESSLADRLRGERAMDERWRRQVKRQVGRYRQNFKPRNVAWDLNYFLRPYNDRWYASLFKQGHGRITGEATPDYSIVGRRAVAHVHEIMPEAKIVFMMRNPIERAWSQALMDLRDGQNADAMPEEELRHRFANKRSQLLTDYLRTLENWGAYFPEEQIFVGFLEDIHFYPNRLLKRLYTFLKVETNTEYKVIKRKIHSRDVETMPTRAAAHLAGIYLENARRLEERFGGYASFWRYSAERLAGDPPEGKNIAYPLYNSPLWDEWVAQRGEGPEPGAPEGEALSGRLSSLRAAS